MLGIVGAGPAGCFFLACLPPEQLQNVRVFERACVGGDLCRYYGEVVANLTRAEMSKAFRAVPQWSQVALPILDKYAEDECPRLADVCFQLRLLMKPILAQVKFHAEDVLEVRHIVGGWAIKTPTATFEFQQVVLCTGATPRVLHYPKPHIPLEMALTPSLLSTYLQGGEHIVVFGTSHSGTLILRNLRRIGCKATAVYHGETPFRWARNHDPEGLKQESAVIADEIVAGTWGSLTPTLLSTSSSVELVRAVMDADYLIYATGFVGRHPRILGFDGRDVETFDPTTALIAPGIWGFGIAYPSLYEKPRGGQAPDIGFMGFVSHILKCIPSIM